MRYGAIAALQDVSLGVAAGEVVALLGDNGAGKSTAIKIISGSVKPTSGRLVFEGIPREFESPRASKELGIEIVYQDLSICMNVDVVANFFMGRELVKRVLGVPVLREREMQRITEKVMADGGTKVKSVRQNAEHLSGGQRQAIELNRFVYWGGKLVVLDEPFAALGIEQVRRGLENIRRVRDQGLAVIIVTHNLHHAFQIADRLVVFRQGRLVLDKSTSDCTHETVSQAITGDGPPVQIQ
ncbi:sugar ABC transporter [Mesorhizobium tianshanense]|nr:sugar ABC transporter [Mesorhizobium tianshanense]